MARIQKGMYAVVNPNINSDPYNLKGKRVYVVKVRGGVASVACSGGRTGLYKTDTLIGLREYQKIYK